HGARATQHGWHTRHLDREAGVVANLVRRIAEEIAPSFVARAPSRAVEPARSGRGWLSFGRHANAALLVRISHERCAAIGIASTLRATDALGALCAPQVVKDAVIARPVHAAEHVVIEVRVVV